MNINNECDTVFSENESVILVEMESLFEFSHFDHFWMEPVLLGYELGLELFISEVHPLSVQIGRIAKNRLEIIIQNIFLFNYQLFIII